MTLGRISNFSADGNLEIELCSENIWNRKLKLLYLHRHAHKFETAILNILLFRVIKICTRVHVWTYNARLVLDALEVWAELVGDRI